MVTLRSPYSPGECERRLRISTERGSPVRGPIGDGAAVLRKRIHYRNSFQTVLALTWEPHGSGAEIECNARMPIFAIVFLIIWFGMVTVIGGIIFISALFGVVEGDRTAALALLPFLLIAGAAIVGLGRFLARKGEKYLIDFVRYTLDAEDAPLRLQATP